MTVRRITVSGLGQLTFFNSDQDSSAKRRTPNCAAMAPLSRLACTAGRTRTCNRRFWRPLLCLLSYCRSRFFSFLFSLSRFLVWRVLPAPRAELRDLQTVRIVLAVLRRRVCALAAIRACERDDRSSVFRHLCSLFDDLRHHARADGTAALADGEAEAVLAGDGSDERDLEIRVVARLALVEELAEHLDSRHHRAAGVANADDLHLFGDLDHAALDAARGHRAAALDGEDVLHRHEEGLVLLAGRGRDVRVDRVHELEDGLEILGVGVLGGGLEGLQRRALDHRDL